MKLSSFHVVRRDENHLQDNRFVSSLCDFDFTELYHDDAIGPKGESVLQHALWLKQADENNRVKSKNSKRASPY